MPPRLLSYIKALVRRSRAGDDLSDELRFHLQNEIAKNIATGMTPEEARYAALRTFGGVDQVKEKCRDARGTRFLEELRQDVRYGLRMMLRSPGFTVVAVLSLALGTGANTAVFSVVNAVLLRSLPYPEPSQLVRVGQQPTHGDVSIPEFEFWKEHSTAFSSMAGYRGSGERRFSSGTAQEWIESMTVTTDFLRVLGVNLALGREFNSEETHAGGPQAIILSDGLWRHSFGSDPQVLGRAVLLDDVSYTIIGVLPRGFWFQEAADALVPLRPTGNLGDTGANTQVVARFNDGVSLRQVEAEMATITDRFRREYVGRVPPEYRGLMVVSYHDWLVGDVRLNLLLLFGATALLLLIACSNLASLLMTRLAARGKELAVRLALGSSTARLLRQLLVENLLLAVLGTIAGLFAARLLLGGLVALIPLNLPASGPIHLDRTVLAFTFAVALGTALLFTFVPFLSGVRMNIHEALKSVGRADRAGSARQRTRSFLVVGEVALSGMLLIGAGLLIQSLYRLHQERLGFSPQGLITFETPRDPRNATALASFANAMSERLQAVPGVQNVAAISLLPLTSRANLPAQLYGRPEHSIGGMEIRLVTPAYFEVMGIPIRGGRSLAANDTNASPLVVLVNETLARTWWPQGDSVGDRILIGRFRERSFFQDLPREVVGIVGDTKTLALKEPPRPTLFIPITQASEILAGAGSLAWIVNTNAAYGIADDLLRAVTEIDPRQRVLALRTMEQIIASTKAGSRFNAWLFGLFAGVAVALAAVGVYGLLSFSVAQRRREIGIRMALGAGRAHVLRLVLNQGVGLTALGLGLGLAGGLLLTRTLSSLLYGVHPNDPLSFVAVSLLLLLVGLTASYFPACRAARVDPMAILRNE